MHGTLWPTDRVSLGRAQRTGGPCAGPTTRRITACPMATIPTQVRASARMGAPAAWSCAFCPAHPKGSACPRDRTLTWGSAADGLRPVDLGAGRGCACGRLDAVDMRRHQDVLAAGRNPG